MNQYIKEIKYDHQTRDYALYLDGDLVGFARTYQEGETTLDTLVHELLSHPIPTAEAIEATRATWAETADQLATVAATTH